MAVTVGGSKMGKGTTYSAAEVKRMASRTGAIKGSALRRTTGMTRVLKLQGQRSNPQTRRGLMTNIKAGKGGFTSFAGGKPK